MTATGARAATGMLSAVWLCCLVYPGTAVALTASGSAGGVAYTVYAPDWTWQKRDLNVLLVLQNPTGAAAEVSVELILPPENEGHFSYAGERAARVTLPPGGTLRHAFINITALDGVPLQTYDFALRIASGDEEARVAYPVRTIRGAAVSTGKWALFLPVGIALTWSILFALVLPRYAESGAWRKIGAPLCP